MRPNIKAFRFREYSLACTVTVAAATVRLALVSLPDESGCNCMTHKELVARTTRGYFGVHHHPGRPKPYQAQVKCGGKMVHLGCFVTAEEAALCVARSPEHGLGYPAQNPTVVAGRPVYEYAHHLSRPHASGGGRAGACVLPLWRGLPHLRPGPGSLASPW